MAISGKYYGKHKGMVKNNIDPYQTARLLVEVPDVFGPNVTVWAMPCVPMAGQQMGIYVVPANNSGVWIEFEAGNPDLPIWTGGFWGSVAEVPALALLSRPDSPSIVLQTKGQNTIVMSDVAGPTGGIMLKSAQGNAFIIVNDTGIYIDNGQGASINVIGPSVDINKGALTIK